MKKKQVLRPFSKLYGAITSLRNFFFRVKILKKYQPPVFTVSVGNLQVGGTGKTPHVEYIINLLLNNKIAVLSRGYGRKTKGFIKAVVGTSPLEIGDEPFQVFNKFENQIGVYVCENRPNGVLEIIKDKRPDVIVLDDAFQHQYITPHLNLLLTTFSDPFTQDEMLPGGNLRELKSNANRADVIIVSKCPEMVDKQSKSLFVNDIRKYFDNEKPIFFSKFLHGAPVSYGNAAFSKDERVVLISGIAKPLTFEDYCKENFGVLHHYKFKDHEIFKPNLLKRIIGSHEKVQYLTTEKDYVKIKSLISPDQINLFFYIPIQVRFEKEKEFNEYILTTFENFESS